MTNTAPSGTTHLIYDTAGRLIAEADGPSGQTIREYVWLPIDDRDGGPAMRPANDNLRGGSRLGAAERDSDPFSPAQLPSLAWPKRGLPERAMPLAVVADIDSGAPKTLFVHADHLDRPIRMTDATKAVVWDAVYKPYGEVFSITGPAALDARFPGQWFQLETGLAYNWHRHYDPTTGRYASPDPLGFVDGPSVYAYAGNSPLMKSDPLGLQAAAIGRYGGQGLAALCSRFPQHCAGAAAAAAQVWGYCRKIFGSAGSGGDPNDPGCQEEWEDAEEKCARELAKPQHMRNRRFTGGYSNVRDCARGHVSERCGGNPVGRQ